jgi:hypothetical protein
MRRDLSHPDRVMRDGRRMIGSVEMTRLNRSGDAKRSIGR